MSARDRLLREVQKELRTQGCGCGKWALPRGVETYQDGDVVHRPNRPCYRIDGSKQVGVEASR